MSTVAKRRKSFGMVVVFQIFIRRHALNVKKSHTAKSTVVCSSPKADNFRDNSITNIDSSTLA